MDHSRLTLLVTTILGGVFAGATSLGQREKEPQPEAPFRLIGAHYYPWYHHERWDGQPTAHTPRLHRYDSADQSVVADHVRWARAADLDFFVISCLSPETRERKTIDEVVLPGLEAAGFRFALHYETPLALGLPPDKPIDMTKMLPEGMIAGDRFVAQFDQIAEAYLQRPHYLRYGGKAVVMVYLVRTMENAGPYLRAARERARRRGVDLYLIADVMYWERPGELDWSFLAEHFEAVTAYNMYYRPGFLEGVRQQYRAAARGARARKLRMIPHVAPGYDDTRLRGAGRPTLDRAGGQFYRDFWGLASEFVGRDQPFLFVTSFNEWHEGTELEPSAEHGDLYLRLTRELARGLRGK